MEVSLEVLGLDVKRKNAGVFEFWSGDLLDDAAFADKNLCFRKAHLPILKSLCI